MSATLPAPQPYQSGENFDRWLRGVEYYMTACSITTVVRKTATVLTLLGLEIQDVLRTLPDPQNLGDNPNEYDVLVGKLKEYYQPKMNVTYERSVLHDIYRKDGESFEAFVTRLRLQADRCGFETDALDQAVLQCAVAHARSTKLQQKFFDRPDLTLSHALEVARHYETTKTQVEDLNRSVASVNRVDISCYRCLATNHSAAMCPFRQQECFGCHRVGHTRAACRQQSRQAQPSNRGRVQVPAPSRPARGAAQPGRQCFRCKSFSHGQSQCPFRSQSCFRCGQVGHIRVACQQQQQQPRSAQPSQAQQRPAQARASQPRSAPSRAHFVSDGSQPFSEETDHVDHEETDRLFTVRSHSRFSPITVEVALNGSPVRMEVDTGASCSMMNSAMFHQLVPQCDLQPQSHSLLTYTNQEVPVEDVAQVDVMYAGQSQKLPLVVVEGEGAPLFGREWMSCIQLDMASLFQVDSPPPAGKWPDRSESRSPAPGTPPGKPPAALSPIPPAALGALRHSDPPAALAAPPPPGALSALSSPPSPAVEDCPAAEHSLASSADRPPEPGIRSVEMPPDVWIADEVKCLDQRITTEGARSSAKNVCAVTNAQESMSHDSGALPRLSVVPAPMYVPEKKGVVECIWGESQNSLFQETEDLPAATSVPEVQHQQNESLIAADVNKYEPASVLSQPDKGRSTDTPATAASAEFDAFMKGKGPPRCTETHSQAQSSKALVKVVKTRPVQNAQNDPDLSKPNIRHTVELNQRNWNSAYERETVSRLFIFGDPVYLCPITGPGAHWDPGTRSHSRRHGRTVSVGSGRPDTACSGDNCTPGPSAVRAHHACSHGGA